MQQAPTIDPATSRVSRPRLLEVTLLVAGASTGFLLITAGQMPDEWESRVTEFLDGALLGALRDDGR